MVHQGAKIGFLQADNDVPRWSHWLLNHLPTLGFSTAAERIGYAIGQSMFTPADTHSSELLVDDRPYAGWLYGGVGLQRRGLGWGGFLTLEGLELQLGVIGPNSYADNMQTWWHHQAPRGWEYELDDEPGIALRYGRAWLITPPFDGQRYFDLIPHGGLSVGNVDTSFRAGATVRTGWNLPDDVSIQSINSVIPSAGGWSPSAAGGRWGFYIFGGVEGRAVLYNAFLDGNAFSDSHHVDKETWVAECRAGFVLLFDRLEFAYTQILQTREFEKQPEAQVYGSFALRVNF